MEICVQSSGIIEYLGAEKCYELIAKSGFTAIDWNGVDIALPGEQIVSQNFANCIYEKSDEEINAYFASEIDAIRKNGLKISQAHAPFPAYIPGHPEVLEYMIGVYRKIIRLCDRIGCKNLVIHGISLSMRDHTNTPASIEALNMHLYESLIPTLLECNVTVCLENLFTWYDKAFEGVCSEAHDAVRYVDALNAKANREVFGFCMDTGRLQLLGKDLRKYVPVLGRRIKCLHIHDNNGIYDSHLAPMTGKVNWNDFCDTLQAIGYNGDLNFETFAQTENVINFDKSLLLPWLQLIFATGDYMRKRIAPNIC